VAVRLRQVFVQADRNRTVTYRRCNRFTPQCRTSPTANTPGRLVSMGNGGRGEEVPLRCSQSARIGPVSRRFVPRFNCRATVSLTPRKDPHDHLADPVPGARRILMGSGNDRGGMGNGLDSGWRPAAGLPQR
jgi:hypothetical protein